MQLPPIWSIPFIFNLTIEPIVEAAEAGLISYEAKLRAELFLNRKIDEFIRPRQYTTHATNVSVDFLIFHILDLDVKAEVLSVNAWLGQNWQDLNLAWKPEEFGGIEYISLRPNEIWKPDIYLLNSAEANAYNPVTEENLWLSWRGEVSYWPPGTHKSVCPVDLRDYPFDEHTCLLRFNSWTYDGSEINITMPAAGYSLTGALYDEHNEWQTKSSTGILTVKFYRKNDYYYDIDFFVTLKRSSPYFHLAIITPTVIAVIITLITFWTPPFLEQKLLISGINVTILFIFVIHLFWVVPRSGSSVPSIVIFCGNAAFFAGLTFLMSIVTTTIYTKEHYSSPPTWILNLLSGWLGVVVCLSDKKVFFGNLLNDDEYGNESNKIQSEWRFIAVAIDRIGFIVYCFSLFIVLAVAFA